MPEGPLQQQRGRLMSENGFGALYWPWILVPTPIRDTAEPGRGAALRSRRRRDGAQRQHGAACTRRRPTKPVRGAVGVGCALNDTEQGELNHCNINAIRQFPGGPPLVWGARTLTDGTQWRYVNVRRLVSYIEDSFIAGSPMGGVRAEQHRAVEGPRTHDHRVPDPGVGGRRAVRRAPPRRPSTSRSMRSSTRLPCGTWARWSSRSAWPPHGRPSVVLRIGLWDGARADQRRLRGRRWRRPDSESTRSELQLPRRARRHRSGQLHRVHRAGLDHRGDREPGGRRQRHGAQAARQDQLLRHLTEVGVTASTELWDWRQQIVDGHRRAQERLDRRLRPGQHAPRSPGGTSSAWPTKWEGSAFNAQGSEIAIDTLVLAHEGLARA